MPESAREEEEKADEIREIEVLEENLTTVEVFLRCQPQIGIGMGVLWQGVTATEVRSACLLMRVPRAEWPEVLDGVQHMAQVVAEIRNAESQNNGR